MSFEWPCQKSQRLRADLGYGDKPVVPAPSAEFHINPIINGQRYQPVLDRPEWVDLEEGFEFSTQYQVGSFLKKAAGAWQPGQNMVVDYELSGPLEQLVGSSGASDYKSAGLFFIRRNGDPGWTGQPPYEGDRWYCGETLPVAAGRHVVEVPLVFEAWGGPTVRPEYVPTPAQFAAALADPEWLALIFGDDTGRAHSVIAKAPGIILKVYRLDVV